MSRDLPSLESARVTGKRVFVRCDFDVPLDEKSRITDDTRLVSGVSTIEYLIEQGATVIAAGHLGRPNPVYGIQNTEYSLLPVAQWFTEEFPGSSLTETTLGEFKAWKIKENFYILENLRFYKGEEEDDPSFAGKLSRISDIYVNEAFGSSHRAHASIVGVCRLLPHFAGFHFQKEVRILSGVFRDPRRPLTVIIGGAKMETKLPLVSKMHRFSDFILVGGEVAESDQNILKEEHAQISGQKAQIIVAKLNQDRTDITPESLEGFEKIIAISHMIIWNGPMGFIEKGFGDSSLKLAKAILDSPAYKIVGGGDTLAFLNKYHLLDKFSFSSVGGGAMLDFLSSGNLPGILALQN